MYGGTHAIVGAAGVALLAAGCGGSNWVASASSSSASEYSSFARCMRSHGVSDFPDPVTGKGGHPGFRLQGGSTSDLRSDNRAFQTGVEACQRLLGHKFTFVFAPSGVGKGA
jgi:hypothetical protein